MQKFVRFVKKNMKDKKYCKVRDHCHYESNYKGGVQSICVPKTTHTAFRNVFNYHYHFIIEELAEEFKK